MRQKKRYVTILLIMLLMMSGALAGRTVQAASAVIKITALSDNIQVGDTFSVSVQVTSAATIGEISQVIKYDTKILQFATESSAYEENDGKITIEEGNLSESVHKYILQFKAIKEGSGKIQISGTPQIYNTDGSVLSFSKNVLSVSVGAKKQKSTNRNLATLSIAEGKLDQEFKKSKTEYTMSVGTDVKTLTITAMPENAGAKVEVSGENRLLVGKNIVTIKVTSETKESKEYSIQVTRGTQTTESEGQEPNATEAPGQESFPAEEQETVAEEGRTIQLKEGVLYITGKDQYEIVSLDYLRMLPKGYRSQSLSIDGQIVEAYQLEEESEKEWYLIYARHGGGAAAFYLYDSSEQTIQRYVERVSQSDTELETIVIDQYRDRIKQLGIIIGINCIAILLLFGTTIHYYKKSRKR